MRSRYADAALVREAGIDDIVRSVMSQVGKEADKMDLRHKPFETVFRYLVPGVLIFRHPLIAIFLMFAEKALGWGPSTIGAYIDRKLGFGGTSSPSQISEGGLMAAAKGIVDKVSSWFKKSSYGPALEKHGELGGMAIVVSAAPGVFGRIGEWFRKVIGQKRLGIIGLLYALLKRFALGLGLMAGIGLLVGPKKGKPAGPSTPASAAAKGKGTWRRYRNVGGVEKSLIMTLNNLFPGPGGKNFSQVFRSQTGKPLAGSAEMDRILAEVRRAHDNLPLSTIDRYRVFTAPSPTEIARRLLPQMKPAISGHVKAPRSTKEMGDELAKILGGKR